MMLKQFSQNYLKLALPAILIYYKIEMIGYENL